MKIDSSNETEILKLLAQGSEYAFIQIFDQYQAKVFSKALKLLKSRDLAMDVVQEVFIRVWNRRIAFAEVKNLEAFIFTMTKNFTLNVIRDRSAEISAEYKYSLQRDITDNTVEDLVIDQQYENLIQQAIEKLTPQQREVFKLSRVDGLNHEEIANRLHISDRTVNNHLNIALKSVREDLKPHIGTILPALFSIFGQS